MADRLIVLTAIAVAIAVVTIVARAVLHRRHALRVIDPADIGAPESDTLVIFTSPFCHGCRQWVDALSGRSVTPVQIDVAEHPVLAAKYKINVTPRVALVRAGDGVVRGEWDHYTPREHDLDAIGRALDIR
ncbi:MAG: thioredoxin domain-containing protein [Solirubrobacterales bacterium]